MKSVKEYDNVVLSEKKVLFCTILCTKAVTKSIRKKVWLKSGGFIIIEQTEACVVIDVNTGKIYRKKNLENNIENKFGSSRRNCKTA